MKMYQNTKCHYSTLTGAGFASILESISEVWTSAIVEWLKKRDHVTSRSHSIEWQPTKFPRNVLIGTKLLGGHSSPESEGDVSKLIWKE